MYVVYPLFPLLFIILFFVAGIFGGVTSTIEIFIDWLRDSLFRLIPLLFAIIRIALFSLLIPLLKKHLFKQTLKLFILDIVKTFAFFRVVSVLIPLCYEDLGLSRMLNMLVWGIIILGIFLLCVVADVLSIKAAFANPNHSETSMHFQSISWIVISCYLFYLLSRIPTFIAWILKTTGLQ